MSNWGRWGADDQLGTPNLITADSRRHAVRLVTDGVSVTHRLAGESDRRLLSRE